MGVRLFKKVGRNAVLTERGATAMVYAERILGLMQDLGHDVARRPDLSGLVRLGVPDAFALIGLPDLLKRLDAQFPDLKTAVTVQNSRVLAQRLGEGSLDLAILSEPAQDRSFRVTPIGWHDLIWVAAAGHAVAKSPMTPAVLAHQRIFVNPAPSNTHEIVSSWFASVGVAPDRICTCNSIAIIVSLVRDGVGISALPRCIVATDIGSGSLRALDVAPALPPQLLHIATLRSATNAAIPVLTRTFRQLALERPFLDRLA